MKSRFRWTEWIAVCLGIAVASGCATLPTQPAGTTLTVLSFNIWEAGGGPESTRFERTVAVIQAADADVVGIQESDGTMYALANAAGYTYYDNERQILSRYPIIEPLSTAKRGGGIAIEVPDAGRVVVYNIHLNADPYGPYELVRDGNMSAHETLQNEYTGNEHVWDARAVINALQAEAASTPVVWMGDFNVPSHLDWDEASRELNGGFVVDWPVSRMIEKHGFLDTYREVHPDPAAKRGLNWTPLKRLDDPEELHDRIDFVYARGNGVSVVDCKVLGEDGPFTDIAFERFPSDHRAVLATLRLPRN